MDLFIKVYWAVGLVSIVGYLIVHYVEIAPLLRKYKAASALTWLTNITHDKDLEKYKEFCIKEDRSLFWYQILSKMNKYTMLYFIGWIISLFLAEL